MVKKVNGQMNVLRTREFGGLLKFLNTIHNLALLEDIVRNLPKKSSHYKWEVK
ncbi:hypothetical protein LCGC14_1831360 [marine sediment metagenome]|uniref:Uncharacterized protein n=1 Tax=marine sediment metagenome TaxID=412755 RepID=A0A0F9GGC0_9ZZZZ